MAFEYCLCLVDDAVAETALGRGRAALVDRKRWNRGATLKIRFIEERGETLERRIVEMAREWIQRSGANLRFSRVDTEPSDIRIGFSAAGSWSVLGTDATNHPGQQTMNFGWLHEDSSDVELRRVVLHEFGHALGLIHEHQHPSVEIPWDREAVYAELSGDWSRAKIDHNLFAPYDARAVSTDGYDPHSIMHYPVPDRWTTGPYSVPQTHDLSDMDIALIRRVYR